MHLRRLVVGTAATTLLITGLIAPASVGAQSRGVSMTTREVHGGQKAVLRKGTVGPTEVKPAIGEEAKSVREPVANGSSNGHRKSSGDPGLSGISASTRSVQPASGAVSFSGINHHQQRIEVDGGNQWSIEPPDQGLCVGGGYVFEAVNNAVAVYTTAGARQSL